MKSCFGLLCFQTMAQAGSLIIVIITTLIIIIITIKRRIQTYSMFNVQSFSNLDTKIVRKLQEIAKNFQQRHCQKASLRLKKIKQF